MKTLILCFAVFALSLTAQASTDYIDNNLVVDALEAVHGIGSGVGGKSDSCLLCHSTASGGPGNINASFGTDFHDTAVSIGGLNDGDDLNQSQLETIFSNATFLALDSDGDGQDNQTEFENNTDPASDVGTGGSSGGSSGGGCGMIAPTQNDKTGFPPALLAILPLMALFFFRKKTNLKNSLS